MCPSAMAKFVTNNWCDTVMCLRVYDSELKKQRQKFIYNFYICECYIICLEALGQIWQPNQPNP